VDIARDDNASADGVTVTLLLRGLEPRKVGIIPNPVTPLWAIQLFYVCEAMDLKIRTCEQAHGIVPNLERLLRSINEVDARSHGVGYGLA
jgi:hypothetical protein